jgi:hypothetical protein
MRNRSMHSPRLPKNKALKMTFRRIRGGLLPEKKLRIKEKNPPKIKKAIKNFLFKNLTISNSLFYNNTVNLI